MNELEAWVAAASAELGLEAGDVDAKAVLDVARDVAHQVLRPGAPLTAYLMGVAVGRGADPADAAARISTLAAAWPTHGRPEHPGGAAQHPGGAAQHPGGAAEHPGGAPEQREDRPGQRGAGRNGD